MKLRAKQLVYELSAAEIKDLQRKVSGSFAQTDRKLKEIAEACKIKKMK